MSTNNQGTNTEREAHREVAVQVDDVLSISFAYEVHSEKTESTMKEKTGEWVPGNGRYANGTGSQVERKYFYRTKGVQVKFSDMQNGRLKKIAPRKNSSSDKIEPYVPKPLKFRKRKSIANQSEGEGPYKKPRIIEDLNLPQYFPTQKVLLEGTKIREMEQELNRMSIKNGEVQEAICLMMKEKEEQEKKLLKTVSELKKDHSGNSSREVDPIDLWIESALEGTGQMEGHDVFDLMEISDDTIKRWTPGGAECKQIKEIMFFFI